VFPSPAYSLSTVTPSHICRAWKRVDAFPYTLLIYYGKFSLLSDPCEKYGCHRAFAWHLWPERIPSAPCKPEWTMSVLETKALSITHELQVQSHTFLPSSPPDTRLHRAPLSRRFNHEVSSLPLFFRLPLSASLFPMFFLLGFRMIPFHRF